MVEPEYTQEELESEEWRPVVGYEGLYSVSSLGRVRRDTIGQRTQAGHIMRHRRDGSKYLRCSLFRDGAEYNALVHVLVAEAFIGPRPPGLEVDHVDWSKTNARACNLRYVTRRANLAHSQDRITAALPRGEAHHKATLTDSDVAHIRQTYRTGNASQPALARQYGVSQSTIWRIVHRVTRS